VRRSDSLLTTAEAHVRLAAYPGTFRRCESSQGKYANTGTRDIASPRTETTVSSPQGRGGGVGRGLGVGWTRGVGVGLGVAVAVGVGVGEGDPQGLTGQLKNSVVAMMVAPSLA